MPEEGKPPDLARAALFVDGFNLYHAVLDLGQPYLKWLDLVSLGNLIIPRRDERLVAVTYFTALRPNVAGSKDRHNAYINALRGRGVRDVRGHYMTEPKDCGYCGMHDEKNVEKQTDINLALAVLVDARADRYDHAYILSADSDQAATFRVMKEQHGDKRLTSVLPPGKKHSDAIMANADAKIELTRQHLERCLLPQAVQGAKGWIRRPREYDPPQGWQPPRKPEEGA